MKTKTIWAVAAISATLSLTNGRAQDAANDNGVPAQPDQVPGNGSATSKPQIDAQQPVVPPDQAPGTAPAIQPSGATPSVTGTTAPIGGSAPTNFGPGSVAPASVPAPQATTITPSPTLSSTPATTTTATDVPTPSQSPAAITPPAAANSTAPAGASASRNGVPDYLQRDQAISPDDQAMLVQMRHAVFPQGPTETWMSSVHFILKDGVVRLVGTVPSSQERQRIQGIVRQIPGVSRIYDALSVNPSAAVASSAPPTPNSAANPAPVLPPTSFPPTNANGIANPPTTNSIYENAPPQAPK